VKEASSDIVVPRVQGFSRISASRSGKIDQLMAASYAIARMSTNPSSSSGPAGRRPDADNEMRKAMPLSNNASLEVHAPLRKVTVRICIHSLIRPLSSLKQPEVAFSRRG
jgi:hypothetical protein